MAETAQGTAFQKEMIRKTSWQYFYYGVRMAVLTT